MLITRENEIDDFNDYTKFVVMNHEPEFTPEFTDEPHRFIYKDQIYMFAEFAEFYVNGQKKFFGMRVNHNRLRQLQISYFTTKNKYEFTLGYGYFYLPYDAELVSAIENNTVAYKGHLFVVHGLSEKEIHAMADAVIFDNKIYPLTLINGTRFDDCFITIE